MPVVTLGSLRTSDVSEPPMCSWGSPDSVDSSCKRFDSSPERHVFGAGEGPGRTQSTGHANVTTPPKSMKSQLSAEVCPPNSEIFEGWTRFVQPSTRFVPPIHSNMRTNLAPKEPATPNQAVVAAATAKHALCPFLKPQTTPQIPKTTNPEAFRSFPNHSEPFRTSEFFSYLKSLFPQNRKS